MIQFMTQKKLHKYVSINMTALNIYSVPYIISSVRESNSYFSFNKVIKYCIYKNIGFAYYHIYLTIRSND